MKTALAAALAATTITALSLTGCGGGSTAHPPKAVIAACTAAWSREDDAIGAAVLAGRTAPPITAPAACATLTDAQSAAIHVQLMKDGN